MTDVDAAIEGLLAKAKSGELKAIAWAEYGPDDQIRTGWQGPGGRMFWLGVAVRMLQARFDDMLQEGRDG